MTSKRTPIPKEQSILTGEVIQGSTQQGRAEALTLSYTAPKEIENDSTLIEEWLVKEMKCKPADAAAIMVEDYDEGQYDDFSSEIKAKYHCELCGTYHQEIPVLRKGLCPDCDDYKEARN